MRTFEEAAAIFDLLDQMETTEIDGSDYLRIGIRMKWIHMLSQRLYPNRTLNSEESYHLSPYGVMMEGARSMEQVGDFPLQTTLIASQVDAYLLVYLLESPYWDYFVTCLDVFGEALEDKRKKNCTYLNKLLKTYYGEFLEEDLYEEKEAIEGHVLYGLFSMFSYDEETAQDDIAGIKSMLYPYYLKAKTVAGEEFSKHLAYIEKAYKVIAGWLDGEEFSVVTRQYGYFFCTDTSADCNMYGYGLGAMDFRFSMLMAPELIEAALFEIHEKYPFLDERILSLKKEGGMK